MEMLDNAGFKNVSGYDNDYHLGLGIHEMGTARMGRDPKTSVLNGNNQLHEVPNVFVTDGAAMTSAGNVNPSLNVYGVDRKSSRFCCKRIEKNEPLKDYIMQRRTALKNIGLSFGALTLKLNSCKFISKVVKQEKVFGLQNFSHLNKLI